MNLENSQNYYGEVLQGSSDLKTDACCTLDAPPPAVMELLRNVSSSVSINHF